VAEDDEYTLADAAAAATRMLKHKVSDAEIKDLLPEHYQDDAFAIARLRNKASDRFEDPWKLWFTEQGLRYATPDRVARARAQRLEGFGDVAVDPACGVGIQLAFLARTFEQAVGIERDEETAELAERNLQALGAEAEAEVVVADALDPGARDRVPDPDVVVCDPARDPEAERRTLDDLSPDLGKIHARYAEDAQAWCYELPPMIDPDRVREAFKAELAYTSLNGDLNRLAIYGGQAREADRSALTLPAGERIDDREPTSELVSVEEPEEILHRVDRTIVRAQLLPQLAHRANADGLLSEEHPRRYLLTSARPAATAFTNDFQVLDTHTWNLMGLREKLKRLDAGHVTLRAGIDPDRYWDVRNALEEGLEGSVSVQLFRVGDQGIIVRPVDQQAGN
jgi:hypothetical protein